MKRQSIALVAAAALAAVAPAAFAHPGPRIWLGNSNGKLGTFIGDNDTNPSIYTPARVFVGGIDEDTLAATGLLDEYPVPGTGIYATEFPAYQVRSDGLSGIATGSSFTFNLGPLLVFDSVAHAFKTTRQMFGNPGPAPQMAEVEGSSSVATGPGIVSGYNFFSYNTATDHAHLVTTLLGNGTQAVDGPQAVYAVPLQVIGGGLSQSLPYYVLVGRNIDITQAPFQDALSVVNTTIASSGGTWIVDTDGDWSTAGNWFANVPSAVGAAATFGGAISAPRTIALDAPRTVGRLTFDNVNRYTISGTATLSLGGPGAATIEVLSGGHEVASPLALNGDTTVNVVAASSGVTASSLQVTTHSITKTGAGNSTVNNVRAAALSITAGTVTILSNGAEVGTSKVGTLAIASGTNASLDLGNNDLVTATARPVVEAQVSHARNSGKWNLPGITSSAARANANGTTNLGVIGGAEYTAFGGNGVFSGQPYAPTDTLVKYTRNGDANFSGAVNFDDYVRIDVGFNTGLTGWSNGDFNYSGSVNFDDYVLIDVAFNTQNGTLGRAIAYVDGEDRSESGRMAPGVQQAIAHLERFGDPYAQHFLALVPEPRAMLLVFGATALRVRLANRRRGKSERIANTMSR